jgi:hypothetical protein
VVDELAFVAGNVVVIEISIAAPGADELRVPQHVHGPDPLTGMRDNWAEHGSGTGLTDLLRSLGSPPAHRRFRPNGGLAVAEAWRPSMGRLGRRMLGSGGQRPGLPGVRGHGEAFAVVKDLQRLAV